MIPYFMNNFAFYQALSCSENKVDGKTDTLNAKDKILTQFLIAEQHVLFAE